MNKCKNCGFEIGISFKLNEDNSRGEDCFVHNGAWVGCRSPEPELKKV